MSFINLIPIMIAFSLFTELQILKNTRLNNYHKEQYSLLLNYLFEVTGAEPPRYVNKIYPVLGH